MNVFLKEFLRLHPELKEYYESEQYHLSLKLINIMMLKGLSSKEMAERIGCSLERYLAMESGDISIPVSEYKKTIQKLN